MNKNIKRTIALPEFTIYLLKVSFKRFESWRANLEVAIKIFMITSFSFRLLGIIIVAIIFFLL